MNFLGNGRQVFYYEPTSPPVTVKYHGLLNQGATCYLNSVLQVLFMTKDFREAVERHSCENHTKCIDGHLKTLFDDLKERTAYTYKITKKLGIDRVYEQRDAAEYFEKILRLTSPEAAQIFHGQLTHKTTCSACGTETETDGPFWHLPLALVDSVNNEDYSVVNSIEEYFRASYFSGENQMYCDQCDGKYDATTKCVMKRHPEVLMLLLKRFEFDYHYLTYVKINCTVDVPCTLQIPENQTYELYAVVEHFGDLRSGHYTATIKSQDDERWWSFNDDRVTSLHYQPFQVDNFQKSSSAYLLFYRRKNGHVTDTCTQDIREVSAPGGFPPATSDIYDQCQDALKMKEREEVERAAEAGNDTAVAVSIYRNEETGIIHIVSNAEDQGNVVYTRESRPNNHQERNEDRNDLHSPDALTEKQRDEGKIITDDEEDMGGNAEVDDQAEKRETLSQLEESVKDQDNDSRSLDDISQRRPQEGLEFNVMHNAFYDDQKHKQEVSNIHVRCDYPQQVQQKDKDIIIMDINRDMDGNMEGYEQSERRGIASTKYLGRDAEHQDNEGLDVRQNMKEDLGGTPEVGQDYDLKPVSVDTQGGEEMMETDVEVDKKGNTGVDERRMVSGRGNHLKIYDLCYYKIPDSGRVGDSEQNMLKDHQGCEQGGSRRYERCEQQREGKRDVKGVKDQKIGDDKYAQMRETSMTKSYLSEGVEHQDKRLDGVRQRRPQKDPEQKICATRTTHQYVSVDKRQENKGDNEHIQDRADSSLRGAGFAGSRGLTENQRVGNVEKTRQGDSQPKARTGINEHTLEGGRGSKKSGIYHGKIIEEEFKTTPSGTQKSSKTNNIRIVTVQVQDGIKSWVEYDEGNDPKTDVKVTLSRGVRNLNLNEWLLPEPRTWRTKALSAARVQAGIKRAREKSTHRKKRRWWRRSSPLKKHRKEKNKRKKPTGSA